MDVRSPSGEAVWNSAAWLAEATAWIDAGLGGCRRLSEPRRWRVTRWSALLTVETAAGRVWMKVPRPECAVEADLYARGLPGLVEPLAVDIQRGWMLLPDAGTPLSDGGDVVEAAEVALVRYAELQRSLGPRVGELLAAGCADLRPTRLAGVLERVCAVAEADLAVGGDPDGLMRHVHAARARIGEVESWAAALASPEPSVDHGDLHLDNVLVGPAGPVLIDWGDAVVGHPFASLRVLSGALGGSRIERVRDAYLEVFTDVAPLDELRELAELATRVAPIHRAVAIQRAVRSLPGEAPADPRWAAFVARELAEISAR